MKVRLDRDASAMVKGRKVQFPQGLAGAEITLQEPPAVSANKPEWVAHAVDMGMTADEANGLTKEALVEQFG